MLALLQELLDTSGELEAAAEGMGAPETEAPAELL
jgi:hypothetical protein